MAAMSDELVALTSEKIHSSLTVSLDPESVGVAVGIHLLSKQAETYDIAYAILVNGGHV